MLQNKSIVLIMQSQVSCVIYGEPGTVFYFYF